MSAEQLREPPEWAIHAADMAMAHCDCSAMDDDFRDELARLIFNVRNSCAPIPGLPPAWAINAARELHSSWWNVDSAATVIARHCPSAHPDTGKEDGAMFNPDLLMRCAMDNAACQIFKTEARKVVQRDEDTGAIVTAYIKSNGHILIDRIDAAQSAPNEGRKEA
jgi:hypothetical protein